LLAKACEAYGAGEGEDPMQMFVRFDVDDNAQSDGTGPVSRAHMWAAVFPEVRRIWTQAYWYHPYVCWHGFSLGVVIISVLYSFLPDNIAWIWPMFTLWFCIEVVMGLLADATRFCWYQHLTTCMSIYSNK